MNSFKWRRVIKTIGSKSCFLVMIINRSIGGQKWILAGTQCPWAVGLAENLLEAGVQLLAFSRLEKEELRFKRQTKVWGDQLICLHGDLYAPQAQEELRNHVQEAWSYADGIIFPGFIPETMGPFKDLKPETWVEVLEKTLNFSWRMQRCFLPLLERSPEAAFLVQVGHTGILEPMPNAAVYGMVAAAQHNLLLSLREEWKSTHVYPFEVMVAWQDLQETEDFKALGAEVGRKILSVIQSPSTSLAPSSLLGR
jgi:NADP-dependent 3-hydroxy acid dehydrogenase YdfG